MIYGFYMPPRQVTARLPMLATLDGSMLAAGGDDDDEEGDGESPARPTPHELGAELHGA